MGVFTLTEISHRKFYEQRAWLVFRYRKVSLSTLSNMTGVSEALKIELRSVLLANQEAVRTGITAQQLLRKFVYLTFSLI